MVSASLKTLGEELEVFDVPSAEEALVVSSTEPLDLVVMDIRLPGMSGLEVISLVRKRRPAAKIILVTGVEDEAIRQKIATAGADAFFFKPIEIDAFLEAVGRCLDLSPQAEGELQADAGNASEIPLSGAEPGEPSSAPEEVVAGIDGLPNALYARLNELKKQVKAVAALVVNDSGQVIEEAGRAGEIATGSPLLAALMHTFRSSLHVSQTMAKGTSESLQYFAAPRQCIYVAPVGMNHALFVVTAGFFGPDKLGMIYHTVHLAVRDLQAILAAQPKGNTSSQQELPGQVTVDKNTQDQVNGMFSRDAQGTSQEQIDGYWESLGESTPPNSPQQDGVLTYDQARNLGLAPKGDEKPQPTPP